MPNLVTSTLIDDFMEAADASEARSTLELGALATVVPGSGIATFLTTPSSANLAAAVTGETGSGALVFATSPTLVTPALGTPSAIVLTNGTGLPISTGVSGLGANVATFLATPSSANLASAVTGETGSGALVFGTSPTLVTPALGTPSAVVLTNATGLPVGGISASGTPGATTFLRGDGSWQTPSGTGDVVGPGSATDNAIVAFDGTTGKLIQNTAATIDPATGDITVGDVTGGALVVSSLNPVSNDGAAIGAGATAWSDLFLASGGVINFNNGNLTLTHSAGVLTSNGSYVGTTATLGSTTSLLLGTAGSAVGNIGFRNATSGTITIAPTTGALGTVTQTLQAVTGTIYCTGGTDVAVADGGTGLSSGTSGGVLAFTASGTIASSGALAANALVIGGGAGAAPSTTTTGTGVLTQLGLAADGSDVDAIGFRGVPQNSQTGNYTCVMADAGKHIIHPSGAGAGDTITIPANGSVAYEIGTCITFINGDSNSCSIAITTDTMTLAGTTTTGTRTLAQNGIATAIKIASTSWIINGTGLS